MSSDLTVIARPHALRAARFVGGVQAGLTVAEIVEEVYRRGAVVTAARRGAVVMINGEIVPPAMWRHVRPKLAAHVVVSMPLHGGGGGGGKNPLATVLSLAAIVVAAVAAPALAFGMAEAVGAGWTAGGMFIASNSFLAIATPLIAGSIVVAGSLLANSLFPVRPASLSLASGAASTSPTYSVSGASNSANKFGAVPVVLGRHKHTPPLGAQIYTEIVGSDEYLRMLLVWGYGPLKIENIRIGDTALDDYDEVEIETREGRETDAPLTLFPASVIQTQIGVELTQARGWVTRNAATAANELSADFVFSSGLCQFDDAGNPGSYSVTLEIQHQLVSEAEWQDGGIVSFVVTDATVGTVRVTKRWTVTAGDYRVRCRRVTADSDSTRIVDDVTWSYLRAFRNEAPINFPHPLAVTALRIRATDQLQSVISDLNATVTSYAPCRDEDSGTWIEAPTQNPAALARLVLTGPANERRRTVEQIDDDSFADFYRLCAAADYRFNMIRDSQSSVWDAVSDILATARAAPTLVDGKWGVIMDTADKPIVQHFTPRNSWGFQGKKTMTTLPHAWRVTFKDEENDYETDEAFVYGDGYNKNNATIYESLSLTGLTRFADVWRQGRYRHAQVKLQPETYSFYADFEHLVCRRGDRIVCGHDVPMWGTGWGRVKALVLDEDGALVGVQLDDRVTMAAGTDYAILFRLAGNTNLSLAVATVEGQTDTLTFAAPIPAAAGPEVGDLASFGEADHVVADLLVKAIRPTGDLVAQIECVDFAPDIYAADQGDIPPWKPNVTAAPDVTTLRPAAPTITDIQSGTAALAASGGTIRPRILVSMSVAAGSPRSGTIRMRYRLAGASSWTTVSGDPSDSPLVADQVTEGQSYEIQAQAVSIYGVASDWTDIVTETVVGQSELPPVVTGYRVSVVGAAAYHAWDPSAVLDLSHARIRWSPALSGATWATAVDVVDRVGAPATSVTTPVMVGTYLIKWVDLAGNESPTAAAVITSIAAVQGLNYVEAMEEGPDDWGGVHDDTVYRPELGGVVLAGSALPLLTRSGAGLLTQAGAALSGHGAKERVAAGLYTLPSHVDLGGPFTCRLTAGLEVAGHDSGSALVLLTEAGDALCTASGSAIIGRNPAAVPDSAYAVALEISITPDDPALPGAVWSEWQAFTVSDYSFRGVRARVRLAGSPPFVSPIVKRVRLTIDMEDRVVAFAATIPAGGGSITFEPAFFAVPEIGLSVADGHAGDSYVLTDKTEAGFALAFSNAGGPVARQVSGVAKAYGARV